MKASLYSTVQWLSIDRPRRLLRKDSGASAVEFALLVPFILMLTAGIIEMTNLYFVRNQLNEIVRDATRQLAVGALEASEARKLVLAKLAEITDASGKVEVRETNDDDDKEEEAVDVTVLLSVSLKDVLMFGKAAESVMSSGGDGSLITVSASMFKH
ncbi:MAG: TadE/TadG family type IV pilus assembly protein [Geminicoccaceae bacterium]